ncbi:hypothetical protein [Coleofasciculus chthonoplastes]
MATLTQIRVRRGDMATLTQIRVRTSPDQIPQWQSATWDDYGSISTE